jgi:elongation factor Ts
MGEHPSQGLRDPDREDRRPDDGADEPGPEGARDERSQDDPAEDEGPEEDEMTISAKQVMDLRAATGMPMMQCKKALEAENGDFEKAWERLRKEGLKMAEKRAARATGEGLVKAHVTEDGRRGTMVAVACETEPVAKTPMFSIFVDRLLKLVDEQSPESVEALLAMPWIDGPEQTVEDELRGLIAKIGENMKVQSFARFEVNGSGRVGAYVHLDHKQGALVSLEAEDAGADTADLAKELCMHIVFAKPTALSRDDIPATVREKEKEIYRAQVEEDPKMAKKPPQVIEKIIEGKLTAFYRDSVLNEQAWFKGEVDKTVGEVLSSQHAAVRGFRRFQVGG